MKYFQNNAAQGDLMLIKVDTLPDGMEAATAENGEFILAHSETGHHHVVMERPGVELRQDPADPLRAFLIVRAEAIEAGDIEITHKRAFDTHETIAPKEPGIYEIRRQREHTAEGFRRVQD